MDPKSLVQSVRAAHAPATDRGLLADVVAGRGEGAFDQIIRRHGPMVFRVCRRVLGHRQDAEDAFQATFVVLFRRAGHVTKPDSLGSWLHGVAVRVSREILAMRTRRRRVEVATGAGAQSPAPCATEQHELAARLDAELADLPPHYRVPVVLCELQGRSRKDAARELGIPEGTLSSRLAKAKKLLGERLARKGVSAVVLAPLLAPEAAAVPPALVDRTVHLLVGIAAGTVPPAIDHVASGVVKAMLVTKLKGLAVTVGIVLLVVGGLTVALAGPGPSESRPGAPDERPKVAFTESKVAAPVPQPAEPEWMKKFSAAYQLKEGEYVKRIPAPFVPERWDFVRVRFPGAGDRSLAGLLTMGVLFVEADGKTVSYRAMVSTDAIDFDRPTKQVRPKRLPLRSVIAYGTGRIGPEVVFDERAKDREVLMECDFVIRKGAPLEKVLPDLQKAIGRCDMDVPKAHPVLSLKEEEHEVYVVSGKFKITPRKWRNEFEVDVYADEAVLNKASTGAFGGDVSTSINSDPPQQFVRELGAFVNRRMVWEAEDPASAPFRAYTHSRWEDKATAAQYAADRDPEKVLKNVSEQTGLVFKKERRKVQVLYVVIPQQKP